MKDDDKFEVIDCRRKYLYMIDNIFITRAGPYVGPYNCAVYNSLMMHINARDNEVKFQPSVTLMANEWNTGKKQIINALECLEQLNMIAIDRTSGKHNKYQIIDPAYWTLPDKDNPTGIPETPVQGETSIPQTPVNRTTSFPETLHTRIYIKRPLHNLCFMVFPASQFFLWSYRFIEHIKQASVSGYFSSSPPCSGRFSADPFLYSIIIAAFFRLNAIAVIRNSILPFWMPVYLIRKRR